MIPAHVRTIDAYLVRQGIGGLQCLVLRRAPGQTRAGAWEVVHGRIEPNERPEDAAVREALEETGLRLERLYSVRCVPFYVPSESYVNIAVVFAGFVAADAELALGNEHSHGEWLPFAEAAERLAWPSARDALRDIQQLLGSGSAGDLEGVLRLR